MMRFTKEKVEKSKAHHINTRSTSVVSSPASPSRDVHYRRALGNQYLASLHEQRSVQIPVQFQAKSLRIGVSGDRYEQEADRVAEQVMRMPELQVQRQCACGGIAGPDGECASCRARRLQRKSFDAISMVAAPPSVHETLSKPGQPLDVSTREFMETRFGVDFSGVRVHTDARAMESAWAVNALAYTVGQNVVFGAGEYQPRTKSGRRLIAHELAHVLQQSPREASPSPRQPINISQGSVSDATVQRVPWPPSNRYWYRSITDDCPCTVDEARASPLFEDKTGFFTDIFHAGATYDFRSTRTYTSIPGTRHGQQCTYDHRGRLITAGRAAGTPDYWSPLTDFWKHQVDDVLPWFQLGWRAYNRLWVPNTGSNCESNNVDVPPPTCTPRYLGGGAYLNEHCIVEQIHGPRY